MIKTNWGIHFPVDCRIIYVLYLMYMVTMKHADFRAGDNVLDLYESLAVEMKCPPDLQPMLESIIPPERVPLLLSFADWLEPAEAAAKLDISVEEVKKATFELYRDGFVIRKKSAIKTRSFYGIVNTLLGEGRLGHLSEEQRSQLKEFYMLARLQIYDRYLAEGRLATSSRSWRSMRSITGASMPVIPR